MRWWPSAGTVPAKSSACWGWSKCPGTQIRRVYEAGSVKQPQATRKKTRAEDSKESLGSHYGDLNLLTLHEWEGLRALWTQDCWKVKASKVTVVGVSAGQIGGCGLGSREDTDDAPLPLCTCGASSILFSRCQVWNTSQLILNWRVPFLFSGKGKKLLLWPHETLLWRMPGQDLFCSVGSHQHCGGNPDGRNRDLPCWRKLNRPYTSPAPPAEGSLTPGVPMDLAVRHYEGSSSVSCNLNKVLKTCLYLLFAFEDICLQNEVSLKRLTLWLWHQHQLVFVTGLHLPSLLVSPSVRGAFLSSYFPSWESQQRLPTTYCQFSSTFSGVLSQTDMGCSLVIGKKILSCFISHL